MPVPPRQTPADLLDAALRRDPARPLLTFYDDATGERAELSTTTFGTWVAKTANLLRDDLAVEAGATVALDLPCHWQAAVWLQSAWALGLHVVPPGGRVDVHVTTYEPAGPPPTAAGEVVALGLGPMALPRRDAQPPAGTTLDYDREVAAHGDRFTPSWPVDAKSPALTTADGSLTGADLAAAAQEQRVPGRALLLTEPLTSPTAVLGGLLVPLATDVTAVLCRNLDNLRLPSRVEQEEVVRDVTSDTRGVPRWVPVSVGAHRNLT
jgi:uncharacterized protein (TIGR03089 family)